MTRDSNLKVDIELSVQSSMDARIDPQLTLRVTDRTSGQPIVQVNLTAGQVLAALSGRYLSDLDGWYTTVPERIGKKMVHRTIDVPRWVTDDRPYQGPEREEAVFAWGEQQKEWIDETVEPRSSNTGWKVTFRRYVEA